MQASFNEKEKELPQRSAIWIYYSAAEQGDVNAENNLHLLIADRYKEKKNEGINMDRQPSNELSENNFIPLIGQDSYVKHIGALTKQLLLDTKKLSIYIICLHMKGTSPH